MKNRLLGIGHYSSQRLDLESIKKDTSFGKILKSDVDFLLFELKKNTFLYLKNFGGISFIGAAEEELKPILTRLETQYGASIDDQKESLTIHIGNSETGNGFGELSIDAIEVGIVHIILLNLAQSAAMFHYQELSEGLIETTRVHTTELERSGKISLGRKKLMQFIGATLNLKNRISENLYIYQSPLLAYENENLDFIDRRLREDLEIQTRYDAIKEQLGITKENLDLFKDLNLHKHSSTLEWIIIILILFEIIHVLVEKMF